MNELGGSSDLSMHAEDMYAPSSVMSPVPMDPHPHWIPPPMNTI